MSDEDTRLFKKLIEIVIADLFKERIMTKKAVT